MPTTSLWVKYGDDGFGITQDLMSHADAKSKIDPSAKIVIKPNLVLAKPSSSGATTDPNIVAGILEYLFSHNYRNVTIMESSWIGDSTERAFDICGYRELAKTYKVPLMCLKNDDTITINKHGLEISVSRSVLEADFLINVPVLKAHCQTRLTCALKNLKGCIPDQEKRRYHGLGLHRPIAVLNTILHQQLIIVDGIIGDLTFEEGGTPVNMHRVILGFDPVAVDSYCAELLGYTPEEIGYLSIAKKLGVGSFYSDVKALNTGDTKSLPKPADLSLLLANVQENQACSACVASLTHALQRLQDEGYKTQPPLFVGQGFRGKSGNGIGIGSCTRSFGSFVPGCPPKALSIMAKIKENEG